MGLSIRSFLWCLLLLTVAVPLWADVEPGDQGYGLMAGAPSGVTFKYWYGEGLAVDAGAGVIGDNFGAYATHLWHDFNLLPKPEGLQGELPFYVGLGTRARFSKQVRWGIRTIVGVGYILARKPLEFFAEAGPFIRVTPDAGISIDGAIGFRYYFETLRTED